METMEEQMSDDKEPDCMATVRILLESAERDCEMSLTRLHVIKQLLKDIEWKD